MANTLSTWASQREFPFKHRPFPLLKEKQEYFDRLSQIQTSLLEMKGLWVQLAPSHRGPLLAEFLKKLDMRDILSILGMRHTEGSLLSFPPSLEECMIAFNSLHKPQTSSKLTVGAKALTKHSHRDESANWWGTVTVWL